MIIYARFGEGGTSPRCVGCSLQHGRLSTSVQSTIACMAICTPSLPLCELPASLAGASQPPSKGSHCPRGPQASHPGGAPAHTSRHITSHTLRSLQGNACRSCNAAGCVPPCSAGLFVLQLLNAHKFRSRDKHNAHLSNFALRC